MRVAYVADDCARVQEPAHIIKNQEVKINKAGPRPDYGPASYDDVGSVGSRLWSELPVLGRFPVFGLLQCSGTELLDDLLDQMSFAWPCACHTYHIYIPTTDCIPTTLILDERPQWSSSHSNTFDHFPSTCTASNTLRRGLCTLAWRYPWS